MIVTQAVSIGGNTKYDIAERYYMWSLTEHGSWDEEPDRDLIRAAVGAAWGQSFFRSYGWARPLFPELGRNERVTLANMEAKYVPDELRTAYKVLNHSVHAGPSETVARLDLTRRYPANTRIILDVAQAARCGLLCCLFIDLIVTATTRGVASEFLALDELLWIGPLEERTARMREAFANFEP